MFGARYWNDDVLRCAHLYKRVVREAAWRAGQSGADAEEQREFSTKASDSWGGRSLCYSASSVPLLCNMCQLMSDPTSDSGRKAADANIKNNNSKIDWQCFHRKTSPFEKDSMTIEGILQVVMPIVVGSSRIKEIVDVVYLPISVLRHLLFWLIKAEPIIIFWTTC